MILPIAGYLCSRSGSFGGWKPTYFISAGFTGFVLVLWFFLAADKPSKHPFISHRETTYILQKTSDESLGKRKERKSIPWKSMVTSLPLIVGILALICHEYPLVIMLALLPAYIKEVLHLENTTTGFVSALPVLSLWVMKTLSSSLASYLNSRKGGPFLFRRTALVKIFNAIASSGLAVSLAVVPLLQEPNELPSAIVAMCMANAFAGLHSPGVQTALLQIAPAFTGVITGISFALVAASSILNKLSYGYILDLKGGSKWALLFEISAVVAALPVIFFSIWGSADLQPWSTPEKKESKPTDDERLPPS
ncbi:hypothetical protein AB6A40_010424 [Gnathostoma spinigerum]|uniref:Major facilitator superfamily (MFS) profile domain-containing protein n=1 Tax=Gnathostoma spinigerum TaxID=75299 RepID=A0ABD6F396_9BILA